MKVRKTLSLHREALAELRSDEMTQIAGAATAAAACYVRDTWDCPIRLSQDTKCESFPVNQCLISVGCQTA